MNKEKDNKKFKRELIPLVIALTILIVLVLALVYTIVYKPKINNTGKVENTLKSEEISVGSATYVCDGQDINKLKDEASKVFVAYEELNDYFLGKAENVDAAPGDANAGIQDVYGLALRTKIYGITDGIYVKVYDNVTKQEYKFYKSDLGKDDFAKYDKVENYTQAKLDIKIYVNDDNCANILLREFEVTLPRYNSLSELDICKEEKNKNNSYCANFVFNSNTYKEDMELMNKELNKVSTDNKDKNDKEEKKSNAWLYISIGVFVVIIGVGVIIMKGRK